MKRIISTAKAPGAIGPYSQAIRAGGMVFTSGQLPINMENGELETNDIKAATRYALCNIKAILESENLKMSDIVKTTVFVTDLADFGELNEAYAQFFSENPPARSCVQVSALPKGAKVEIEAVALKP